MQLPSSPPACEGRRKNFPHSFSLMSKMKASVRPKIYGGKREKAVNNQPLNSAQTTQLEKGLRVKLSSVAFFTIDEGRKELSSRLTFVRSKNQIRSLNEVWKDPFSPTRLKKLRAFLMRPRKKKTECVRNRTCVYLSTAWRRFSHIMRRVSVSNSSD